MDTLKKVIVKAANIALINELKRQLIEVGCKQIKIIGETEQGIGFSILDFSQIKGTFVYRNVLFIIEVSKNGGQFYISSTNLFNKETCLSAESMIKKINKKLAK
jgi:hypothetical protein